MTQLHAGFLRKHSVLRLSRSPGLQIVTLLRLLTPCGAMAYCIMLPAYSDRIAQDSHLIPYYPYRTSYGTETH